MTDLPFQNRNPIYTGTAHGIDWAIYQSPLSCCLNGYVRIPDGLEIDVDTLEVHGGITYGAGNCTGWIGFDTAHSGDWWSLEELREKVGVYVTPGGERFHDQELAMQDQFSRRWTVAMLVAECEKLAKQVADRRDSWSLTDIIKLRDKINGEQP